ncbi:malonyl-CoA/methylmalonyl-CoA synthetase, partial [Lecanoromycetidae sp. Uapishka_2]
MASTFPDLPIFRAISSHDPQSTAIIHSKSNRRFTYGELLKDVEDAKIKLYQQLKAASPESIGGQRVAFLVENGYDYVVTLLSIFACDNIAVPLSSGFPASELRYILDNSEALMLVSSQKFQEKAEETLREGLEHLEQKPTLNIIEKRRQGNGHDEVQLVPLPMNKGGVLLPESVLTAQAQSLLKAWQYTSRDHLLHVLPLHHIHGTVNAVLTPLFAGSTVEFMFPFNVDAVWERLAAPFMPKRDSREPITFLTVVPTIYNRFLGSHEKLSAPMQDAIKQALAPKNLRLNISGSAALPTPTKEAWTKLSGGNILLERYGMTEVGMALSCGLKFQDRVDGSVGWPLPSVQARLIDSETNEVISVGNEIDENEREREGEIQLRGPTVFSQYWRNERATLEEFVAAEDGGDKWFKTGDIATRRDVEGAGQSTQDWAKGPMYFIRGRKSTDIIKSGGEKVSALEIERELLSLPQISEAAVVGIASEQWGQKVAAVVILDPAHAQTGKGGKKWGVMDMRRALKDKLANYKIPQELKVVEDIPKNAMGKTGTPSLAKIKATGTLGKALPL